MSYYYKYSFISPEGIFAIILEELKSYFDTGSIDTLMFNVYLNKCLDKLGRSSYSIVEGALVLDNFEARLPDNFYAVREAWKCLSLDGVSYQLPNAYYALGDTYTTQIFPVTISYEHHHHNICCDDICDEDCLSELPVYKTTSEVPLYYTKEYMLKPGNISARNSCDVSYVQDWDNYTRYSTPNSNSYDSFDVRDNKFVTNFRDGIVHLVFYATDYDEVGNQLVPDNFRIKEYIEKFIKYKMFETLTNQCNDETFNQLQQKMIFYKQEADEAYILANIEIKKPTVYQSQRRLRRQLNSFNMYELPNRTNFYGRRRNN